MANKKRPRYHSTGDSRAVKRSIAGSQECIENSETLNDIADGVTRGGVGGDSNEMLQSRVCALEATSKQQENRINDLLAKVEFLLSLLGISEGPSKDSKLS